MVKHTHMHMQTFSKDSHNSYIFKEHFLNLFYSVWAILFVD